MTFESGSHTVTVRAVDADGNVQISERRPAIPGSATGLHDRDFTVGLSSRVHALPRTVESRALGPLGRRNLRTI